MYFLLQTSCKQDHLDVLRFLRRHSIYHFKRYSEAYSNRNETFARAREELIGAWNEFEKWWHGYFGVRDIWVWGPNLCGFCLGLIQLALKLLYPAVPTSGSNRVESVSLKNSCSDDEGASA